VRVGDLYVSLGIRSDGKSWADSRQQLKRFGRQAERDAKGIGRRIAGFKIGGVLTATTGVVAGAGAALGLAYKNAIDFDDGLARLDINSRGAMGSMAQVRAQILGVSSETGVAKEELLAGASSFVALTGDGKAASEALKTFARVQKATGADMGDITASAASLSQQLGIGAGQYEDAFSILVAGGKAGKIELKDMAGLMASLSASSKQFAGSQGLGGLASLSGAFQISARNFGSASEAATGLESLMGSIIQHSGKLKEAGVRVFEPDGKTLKSLEEIVDLISGKGFNPTQLIELLGRKEAYKTLQALRDNRKEWGSIARETRHAKDVSVDYDKYNKSSSAQLKKAWNDIKLAVTSALTPERIQAFTMFLKEAVGMALKLVEALSHVPGYIEFLGGEGKVANQEGDDMLDNLLIKGHKLEDIERIMSARGVDAIGPRRDLAKAAGASGEGEIQGAESSIQEAVKRRRATNAQISKRDVAKYGFSPGSNYKDTRRMDVEASRIMDVPTMMEADAARGAFSPVTNITINAPAGADAQQYARVARDEVNRALDVKSRELAAQLGQ
jgi:TP901 family phage tail tape measure protein